MPEPFFYPVASGTPSPDASFPGETWMATDSPPDLIRLWRSFKPVLGKSSRSRQKRRHTAVLGGAKMLLDVGLGHDRDLVQPSPEMG